MELSNVYHKNKVYKVPKQEILDYKKYILEFIM